MKKISFIMVITVLFLCSCPDQSMPKPGKNGSTNGVKQPDTTVEQNPPADKSKLVALTFHDKSSGKQLQPNVSWKSLDGEETTYQPGMKLRPGKYEVEISLAGYQKIRKTVEVTGDYRQAFQLVPIEKSSEKLCQVTLQVTGVQGKHITPATATLNGTVLAGTRFAPGEYELVVSHPGYQTLRQKIVIPSGIETHPLPIDLEPATRKVSFRIVSNATGKTVQPEEILVDGKPFNGTLTPGEHQVAISVSGYKKLQSNIFVEPGSEAIELLQQIEAIARAVVFVAVDAGDDTTIKPDFIRLNGQDWEKKAVFPGEYRLEIGKKGYESATETVQITPGGDTHTVKVALRRIPQKVEKAQKRLVVIEVFSDSAPKTPVAPQLLTINGMPYTPGFAIAPGTYPLMASLQPGHLIHNENLTIPAGEGEYRHTIELKCLERMVELSLKYKVKPETSIAKCKVYLQRAGSNEKIEAENNLMVKPGTYKVTAEQPGYQMTSQGEVFIAPDSMPFRLTVAMSKKEATQEQSDDSGKTEEQPDDSGTEEQPDDSGKTEEQPDDSETAEDTGTTTAENTGTTQKQNPVSHPVEPSKCKVEVEITSNFPGPNPYKVSPQMMTLGGSDLDKQREFAAGSYELVVQMPGYREIREQVEIPADKAEYTIERALAPAPRQVSFDVIGDNGEKLTCDKILVDGKDFSGQLLPGKHTVVLQKAGYEKLEEEIFLDLDAVPETLHRKLRILERSVEFKVVDKDSGEALVADIFKINGKAQKQAPKTLYPDEYQVKVSKDGYETATQSLSVSAGEDTFVAEFALVKEQVPQNEERELILKVFSDSDPQNAITPDIISLNNQRYTAGAKYKPGNYDLVAWKSGHIMYSKKIEVPQGQGTFEHTVMLECTPRKLDIYLKYDVKPAPTYPACEIYLTRKANGERIDVSDGQMIKPGIFSLDVRQVGYTYKGEEQITIAPGSEAFDLRISLLLQNEGSSQEDKRETKSEDTGQQSQEKPVDKQTQKEVFIVKGIDPNTKQEVLPYKVFIDGKLYDNTPYEVGATLRAKVLFREYKTYEGQIRVDTGPGGGDIYLPIVPLKKITFINASEQEELDGILYNYDFTLAEEPIEEHFVTNEKKDDKVYFYLYLPEEAREVVVSAGYRYREKSLLRPEQDMGYLSSLHAAKLANHIDKVREKFGEEKAFDAFESAILRNFSKLRRSWYAEEKELILDYCARWQVENPELVDRHGKLMKKIERMLGN